MPPRLAIQERARDEKCKAPGCDQYVEAKSLCSKHYQRMRRGYINDHDALMRRYKRGSAKCSVEGCDHPHRALGLCNNHWLRQHNGLPMDQPVRIKRSTDEVRQRDESGLKQCVRCGEWLDETAFGYNKKSPDGLSSYCASCTWLKNRISRLKMHYGLSVEDFNRILSEQLGECAICRSQISVADAHVDHDHSCCGGRTSCGNCVRGLLCNRCNMGLGAFRDNAKSLTAAVIYLENWANR